MFALRKSPAVKGALGLLAVALLFSVPSRAADDKVDVTKLNQVVQKLVGQVLLETQKGSNPLFKALEIKLDDKGTDLTSDNQVSIKLDASATVSRTIWAPNSDTSVELDIAWPRRSRSTSPAR
jgi:hypothetical protein